MAIKPAVAPVEGPAGLIHSVRGLRGRPGAELARIHGMPLKRLNKPVRRNADRFPRDLAFQPEREEAAISRPPHAAARSPGGRRTPPRVFTEHGARRLSSVISSPVAGTAGVRVVRAFVAMRQQPEAHPTKLARPRRELEARVTAHDAGIQGLSAAVRRLIGPPLPASRRESGFHAQETPPPCRVRPDR